MKNIVMCSMGDGREVPITLPELDLAIQTAPYPVLWDDGGRDVIRSYQEDYIAYWYWPICGKAFVSAFSVGKNDSVATINIASDKAYKELIGYVQQVLKAGMGTVNNVGLIEDGEVLPSPVV